MRSAFDAKNTNTKLFAVLHVSENDLGQAKFFAEYIAKRGWHFEPWERRWTVYMQQAAFTTALVTAYARPFTESRGWPKLPDRLLRAFSPEQRALHKRILTLRNEIYAHSDIGIRGIRAIRLGGYATAIEALPPMRLLPEEVNLLRTMISVTLDAIRMRKNEVAASEACEA